MFIQLPFVRLFIAGRSSVQIFFVISGFVLSLKPLALIHKGKHSEALDSLSAAAFRRYLRLYLPVAIVTAVIAVLRRSSLPWQTTGHPMPPLAPSATTQFYHWVQSQILFGNIFPIHCGTSRLDQCPAPSEYDNPVWTIPIEFKWSMIVFLFLLAFARIKRWVHFVVVTVLSCYHLSIGQVDLFLFCGGMLLAEVSLLLPSPDAMRSANIGPLRRLSCGNVHLSQHLVAMAIFVVACYILSYPSAYAEKSPGFRTMAVRVPEWYNAHPEMTEHYWHSIGAVLFILALMLSPPLRVPKNPGSDNGSPAYRPFLQRLFTNRVAQYLGFISFSMYLCHDSVISTVGTLYAVPGRFLSDVTYDKTMSLLSTEKEKLEYLGQWRSQYYSLLGWGYFWCKFFQNIHFPCAVLSWWP